MPITPRTIAAPVSDEPSWSAQQRSAQGVPFDTDPEIKRSTAADKEKTTVSKPDYVDVPVTIEPETTPRELTITPKKEIPDYMKFQKESIDRIRTLAGLK